MPLTPEILRTLDFDQALKLLQKCQVNGQGSKVNRNNSLVNKDPKPTAQVAINGNLLDGGTPSSADTSSRKFFYDDHWQNGHGWVGPRPPVSEDNHAKIMAEIRRNFVSYNAVKDVVVRHRDGVLGTEPLWRMVPKRPLKKKGDVVNGTPLEEDEKPNERELSLMRELEHALTIRWNDLGFLELLHQVVVWALTEGRGHLRFIVLSDSQQVLQQSTVEEALSRIWVEAIDPSSAGVFLDTETMISVGIYTYTYVDPITDLPTEFVELTFLDEQKNTVVRKFSRNGQESESGKPLELSGKLTLVELEIEPLITEQVRSNQALLNMGLTMMGRNVVQGGFLERIILNAQLPGTWEDDPRRPGKQIFIPNPINFGAGTTNVFTGISFTEKDGKTVLASPSVVYRDPVEVKTFDDTIERAYLNILRETHQVHSLITGDARASGDSRKQARDDYKRSLKKTKIAIDKLGRISIELMVKLAVILMKQSTRYDSLRVDFNCQIDIGPISADDRNAIINEVKAGVKPVEDAMAELGIEDTDVARAKVLSDQVDFWPNIVVGQKIPTNTGPGTGQPGVKQPQNPSNPSNPNPNNPGGGLGNNLPNPQNNLPN